MPSNTLSDKKLIQLRFWNRVDKSSDCWIWLGPKTKDGYGVITAGGAKWLTHRFAYWLRHGRLARDQQILHTCDNPPCVRFRHLYKGNPKLNARDRLNRGREPNRKGVHNPHSILDLETVRKIRRSYKRYSRTNSCRALAKQYGVSYSCVQHIVSNRNWTEEQIRELIPIG